MRSRASSPPSRGLGEAQKQATALAAEWPTSTSLRTLVFYTQREQVLASDKERTCFANNQSDLKPRVKTEVSVCSSPEPGSMLCFLRGGLGERQRPLSFCSPRRTPPLRLTPHSQSRLQDFALLPTEPGASLK